MDRNKTERYIDLHLHTKFSDGECSLEEMIADARNTGLSAIAITDHNCFAINEPLRDDGLEVIPGAEFSTIYKHGTNIKTEVHIVGLFFDGVPAEINHILEQIHKDAYAEAIIKKLNDLGIPIKMEELRERYRQSKQFGRTQIADLIVEKGFASDRANAMDRWIGNFSPYYINPLDCMNYIGTEDCIREILAHGGFPILAHPFHYKFTRDQIEELVSRYRSITDKPMAMEVYYGKYGEEEVQYLEGLAKKYHLLSSAGSDRHHKDQTFVKGTYALLEEMKKAACASRLI